MVCSQLVTVSYTCKRFIKLTTGCTALRIYIYIFDLPTFRQVRHDFFIELNDLPLQVFEIQI